MSRRVASLRALFALTAARQSHLPSKAMMSLLPSPPERTCHSCGLPLSGGNRDITLVRQNVRLSPEADIDRPDLSFENWHRFFNLTAECRGRRQDFIKVLAGSAAVTGSPQLG